ncbi:MAG: M67 family metallopeptidase [Mariprofundaceae bacterium]|nr:M67 family metallopeptidase [Mariprofundaceae bacterium]
MVDATIYEPERFRSAAYLAVLERGDSALSCRFADKAWSDMQHIAAQGYPDEICGLLVGTTGAEGWLVTEVRQVANLNEERAADRFQLDPAGYQKIDSELRASEVEIIGVFHSHPDCPAKPSPTDLNSAWEGFVYPIVSVCDGKVAEVLCWVTTDDAAAGGKFQKLPHSVERGTMTP